MIILAFPGMGKSPLSKKVGKFYDLDYGHIREAYGKHLNDVALLNGYVDLVAHYSSDGYSVLTNNPDIMSFLKVSHVYLPADVKRAASKLKVSEDQAQEWVQDWDSRARRMHVPVTYLKVGLDHYLSSKPNKSKKGGGHNGKETT